MDSHPVAAGGPRAEHIRDAALHSNHPNDGIVGDDRDALRAALVALRAKSAAGLDLGDHIRLIEKATNDDDVVDTDTFARAIYGLKRTALRGADLSSQITVLERIHKAAGGDDISNPGIPPQEGNGLPVTTGHEAGDALTAEEAARRQEADERLKEGAPQTKPDGSPLDQPPRDEAAAARARLGPPEADVLHSGSSLDRSVAPQTGGDTAHLDTTAPPAKPGGIALPPLGSAANTVPDASALADAFDRAQAASAAAEREAADGGPVDPKDLAPGVSSETENHNPKDGLDAVAATKPAMPSTGTASKADAAKGGS